VSWTTGRDSTQTTRRGSSALETPDETEVMWWWPDGVPEVYSSYRVIDNSMKIRKRWSRNGELFEHKLWGESGNLLKDYLEKGRA